MADKHQSCRLPHDSVSVMPGLEEQGSVHGLSTSLSFPVQQRTCTAGKPTTSYCRQENKLNAFDLDSNAAS